MASTSEEQTKPPKKSSSPPPPEPVYTQQYYNYPPQYPPPYPPPHPAYPHPAYATVPPPAAYYYNQQYQSQPRSSAGRFMVLTLLLFSFFFLTLLLLAGSDIPDFYVQSLSVPSFNVTNDALVATWDASITVKKHSDKLDMYFDRIEGIMFSYDDDNALGTSQDQNFDMGKMNEAVFNIKLSTSSLQQVSSPGNYRNLVQEKGKGTVSFSLKMLTMVTYRSGTLWAKHAKFKILCENLEVRFANSTSPGNLVLDKDKQHRCLLYGNRMYADE